MKTLFEKQILDNINFLINMVRNYGHIHLIGHISYTDSKPDPFEDKTALVRLLELAEKYPDYLTYVEINAAMLEGIKCDASRIATQHTDDMIEIEAHLKREGLSIESHALAAENFEFVIAKA